MGWHGRYGGQRMTVYAHILPGAESIARWMARTNISEEAKSRLKVIDWFRSHEHNISLTARHFGLERKTVRRWLKRFQTRGLLGLNSESRRPRRFRHPTTPWQVVQGVVDLRNQYPAWSKYKIMTMLAQITAIDVLSKIRVLDVYSSQSSRNGARFLEQCIACLPFRFKERIVRL